MYFNKNTKFTELFNTLVDEMFNTLNNRSLTTGYNYSNNQNGYTENTHTSNPYLGTTTVEKGVDTNGNNWVETTYTSNDGAYTYTTRQTTSNTWDTPSTWNTPSNTWLNNRTTAEESRNAGRAYSDRLETLKVELNRAVTEQKYEEAARIKRELDAALRNDETYSTLRTELDTLVRNHNYEQAIEVRDRIREYENRYAYTNTPTNAPSTSTTANDATTYGTTETRTTRTQNTTTSNGVTKKGK